MYTFVAKDVMCMAVSYIILIILVEKIQSLSYSITDGNAQNMTKMHNDVQLQIAI